MALNLTRGSIKDVAIILHRKRKSIYIAIQKYELGGLLQRLRDAQTPDQQRIERARKELQSHG